MNTAKFWQDLKDKYQLAFLTLLKEYYPDLPMDPVKHLAKYPCPYYPKFGAVFTTPAMAEVLNAHQHPLQRNRTEDTVDQLVKPMNADRWLYTHQGVAHTDQKFCIDGQTRYRAIMKSGKGVWLTVCLDIPDKQKAADGTWHETITVLDQNDVRKLSQHFAVSNIANPSLIASCVKGLQTIITPGSKMNIPVGEYIFDKYEDDIMYIKDNFWRQSNSVNNVLTGSGHMLGVMAFMYASHVKGKLLDTDFLVPAMSSILYGQRAKFEALLEEKDLPRSLHNRLKRYLMDNWSTFIENNVSKPEKAGGAAMALIQRDGTLYTAGTILDGGTVCQNLKGYEEDWKKYLGMFKESPSIRDRNLAIRKFVTGEETDEDTVLEEEDSSSGK